MGPRLPSRTYTAGAAEHLSPSRLPLPSAPSVEPTDTNTTQRCSVVFRCCQERWGVGNVRCSVVGQRQSGQAQHGTRGAQDVKVRAANAAKQTLSTIVTTQATTFYLKKRHGRTGRGRSLPRVSTCVVPACWSFQSQQRLSRQQQGCAPQHNGVSPGNRPCLWWREDFNKPTHPHNNSTTACSRHSRAC